jgi:hypothetical protein
MHANREDDETHHMDSVFRSAIDPVTGKLDPAKVIAGLGAHTPAAVWSALIPKDEDPLLDSRRELLEAQIANYDSQAQGRQTTDMDRREQEARIRSLEALAGQRTHAAAKPYFAPPRARSGGGGGGGGSSHAPMGGGSPVMDAIAAELKRRGKL